MSPDPTPHRPYGDYDASEALETLVQDVADMLDLYKSGSVPYRRFRNAVQTLWAQTVLRDKWHEETA